MDLRERVVAALEDGIPIREGGNCVVGALAHRGEVDPRLCAAVAMNRVFDLFPQPAGPLA